MVEYLRKYEIWRLHHLRHSTNPRLFSRFAPIRYISLQLADSGSRQRLCNPRLIVAGFAAPGPRRITRLVCPHCAGSLMGYRLVLNVFSKLIRGLDWIDLAHDKDRWKNLRGK
jgi:hypothetical protein